MPVWVVTLVLLSLGLWLVARSPVRVQMGISLADGTLETAVAVRALWGVVRWQRDLAWTVLGWSLLPPFFVIREGRGALPAADGERKVSWERLVAALRELGSGDSGGPWSRIAALARPWRLVSLRADLTVGTGDAASTALAYGAVWSTFSLLAGAATCSRGKPERPVLTVAADFRRAVLQGSMVCIAEARLVNIMTAGWLAHQHTVSRNLVQGAANPGPATPAH